MRPSQVTIGALVFVACLIALGNIVGNFTTPDGYGYSVNTSSYNRTFSKFNQITNQTIQNQEKISNATLAGGDQGVSTDYQIIKTSGQVLISSYDSARVAQNLTQDVQNSMKLPFNIFAIIITIMILLISVGIVSAFFKYPW